MSVHTPSQRAPERGSIDPAVLHQIAKAAYDVLFLDSDTADADKRPQLGAGEAYVYTPGQFGPQRVRCGAAVQAPDESTLHAQYSGPRRKTVIPWTLAHSA